jgi:hypothetical protein
MLSGLYPSFDRGIITLVSFGKDCTHVHWECLQVTLLVVRMLLVSKEKKIMLVSDRSIEGLKAK